MTRLPGRQVSVGSTCRSIAVAILTLQGRLCIADDSLDEVVVTATRHATRLRDTAVSVTAVTAQELQNTRSIDIEDWFARVPGLNFSNNGQGIYDVSIRGLGQTFDTRPMNTWYVDDTPMNTFTGDPGMGQFGAALPQAIDLTRIEVLRGPQGTLFGSSSLGGAIRMITARPDLSQSSGWVEADLSASEHGGENFYGSAMWNIALKPDVAALRLVAYDLRDSGFIDNTIRSIEDIDSARNVGGRAAARWKTASTVEFNLSWIGQKRTTDGFRDRDFEVGPYEQQRSMPEHDDEEWNLGILTVDYELPWATLSSHTSYARREPRLDFDIIDITELYLGERQPASTHVADDIRDFVQELRLVSAQAGRLSWLLGAYYQEQERVTSGYWTASEFVPPTGEAIYALEVHGKYRHRAIYGEVGYKFSPSWRASLGARVFDFDDKANAFNGGYVFGASTVLDSRYSDDGVTPRISVEFRGVPNQLIFATAAQGFRPGGANVLTDSARALCAEAFAAAGMDQNATFQSDDVWNYELGARTRWLGGQLSADATLFHIDWRNMQGFMGLPSCFIGIMTNSGRVFSDGAELELTWLPAKDLEFALVAGYIDARLAEDEPRVLGTRGQSLPMVPRWTGTASARREFSWSEQLAGFAQLDYSYIDDMWNTFFVENRNRLPSRSLLNLRVGARTDGWNIELYAENLLDVRGIDAHSNSYLNEFEHLIRPRTFGLRARADFR